MKSWRERMIQRLPCLLGISALVIVLDQMAKNWIFQNLNRRASIAVIDGFFHFVHVHNTGAAFGLFSGWKQSSLLLTCVSITAILCILIYYFLMPVGNRLTLIALSLVVGGAVGNLIDRFRWGFVVDFIDWHYKNIYHWPAFNLADSAITIAMGLLLIELVLDFRRQQVVQGESS